MHAVCLLFCILRGAVQRSRALTTLVLPLLLFLQLTAYAQSANLDQGANEQASAPTSPVDWVNGNLNSNQAHFLEGYSVPYRAILTGLVVNQTYTLVIGFDVRSGSKQALDYLTHYQRLSPHTVFGHAPETVNPLLNAPQPVSYFTTTDVLAIPAPSSAGSPMAGQPTTSFNTLPSGERELTGYNVDLLTITYASQGSLTAASSETVVNITFKALKETAILAWGGHIASVVDWGRDPVTHAPNSASAISGSPYHMSLKKWIINGSDVSIGNQDRSLKTDAVFIPPKCEVTGPLNGCAETTKLTYVATVDDSVGLTYAWSIIGANTAGAKIVNPTLGTIDVVPIGAAFTPGSFNLRLIVTREGLKDTCYINSHTNPGASVVISQVIVNAGSDQTITNLDVAHLSASATGGTGTYTFTWTPVTGLSNPNIANPDFTPTTTGVFQFVVKADDGKCSDLDTVVITVNEHPKAPCGIDGPSPVCPGSQNQYTGPDPSLVGSYLWSVLTGDGTINGVNNTQKVLIDAAAKCGAYRLRLIVTTPDLKRKDTCYLDVDIKDTIKPVLNGDVAGANVACAKDVPAPPTVGVTDNCTAELKVQTSRDVVDSTCVNKFKIIRKWWATDLCGNTADTLKQVITVNDDVKPVITADFDKTVNVQCLKDIPALPKPTATDNCNGDVTPVYSETGSGTACDSSITRKWVFTDACGNSDSVSQVINIKDDTKPVLSGTADDVNASCSKDIPAVADISATDNCDLKPAVHYIQEVIDSTCVNKFKVIRKWWAEDACGNISDTLTQLITVNDDVKPVITADFEKTVSVECLKDLPAVPKPTATDNCDGNIEPVYSETGSGTTCDSTITRKWIFSDACGNTDSVTQVIHIKDDIKPVRSGNTDDMTVTCSKDIPAPADVKATDNCDIAPVVYFSQKTVDSTCVNKFKVIRKWWAKDACGNTSVTLTQVITVYDDVKPVITADFEKAINVQCLKDVPAPPKPTATDNCDGDIPADCSVTGSGTACDSTITRKWIFTDACGNSDSVTQVINIKDDTKPVLSGTADDVNVTCSKDIPEAAKISATDNCGEPTVYFKQKVIDSTCVNKFKVIRKWWAEDACGNTSDTLKQLITVNDDVKPVITAGFEKTVNVQCLKDIPGVPKPTATDNCNGDVTPVYSATGTGTACDSTITRKWVFTDVCGNSDSVSQVINIKDDIKPVVTYKPNDTTILCISPVVFGKPTFSDNCGTVIVTYEDRKEGTTCPFRYIRTWTAKDKCNNSVTVEQVVTVPCCLGTFCAYTQGFYGNVNGSACTPSGTSATAKQLMSAAVDAQPGDSVIFGLKATGKFFTLFLGDITNDNIFKMLPGGGTPVALKGYATFSKTNTWANVPILTTATNYGKINNVLLAQTMSLFFNMQLSATLQGVTIDGDTVLTAKLTACGSNTPTTTVSKFALPPSVVNYLKSVGKANVAGLYELANMYLGGQTVAGVAIGDVSKAVDAINNAFDKCAVLVGWKSSSGITTLKVSGVTAVAPATDPKVAAQGDETTLNVTVFPNPYNDKVIFRFVAPVSGQVKLEVYNVLGQNIGQLNYGRVDKGTQHTIEYNVPAPYRDVLLYRLNVGEHFRTGKVIPAKK
ncbi:HYR-like domain-containing protein [Chitinophaga filiformis]|uniref:HYR-like domain-containing protein n=1 Tax=Chitinophaga filiformis TaxID=104663 RepID=A0A1G7T0N3_CHIFI|nr:hypothetical protein [Chitinophaga filiformis]SDG28594.1 hypothetical protein SAMN04488121_1031088 [Chitinophaga filiformis]